MAKPTEGALPTGHARARGLDRAIELLECLHGTAEPLRIGEIAKRLGAPRSTIYEIVNRFVEAGILEIYGEGRVFFGRTVHFYGTHYLSGNMLARRARDEVERLARLTNETSEFCMLHGNKYTVVHMQTGAKMFRLTSGIGAKVPIPWTASGRLLLGHMTPAELDRFLPDEDFVLPDGRLLERRHLYAEIEAARAQGFFETSGLVDSFTHCMAAPIRDPDGVAIATICFVVTRDTGPELRRELKALLIGSAAALSAAPARGDERRRAV